MALLLSRFRRLDLVEDALGDAVEAAGRTWPVDGTPDNPAGFRCAAGRAPAAARRIVGAGIPFAVPDAAVLADRLDIVAQTAYLAFTAGYAPGSGPDLVRADLSGEAIRLVRVVLGLRPDEPALVALLALMLLQHSRRDARIRDGRLVLLADQDRRRWHHDEVAEAVRLLSSPVLTGPVTPLTASYALQARIATEHATGEETGRA